MTKKLVVPFVLTAVLAAGRASAQTTLVLPDSSQTTVAVATVAEQALVTVPSGITFNVANVALATATSGTSLTVSNIVLSSATKQLKVSMKASAAAFTPPVAGAATWNAGDVSWSAASWANAAGVAGTLSSSAFTEVASCAADTASCSTSGLVFTLAPKSTVKRAGNHTLTLTWKFETIGT